MLALITPTARLHASWTEAYDEWPADAQQDGAGLRLAPDGGLDRPDAFAAWVERLRGQGDATVPAAPGRVHATYLWIVDGDTCLGAAELRHSLDDFLLGAGGHIGYSVRPSARRRGVATWALGELLTKARGLGLDRVLVTCDEDNSGSARTIERNGGVLEDVRTTAFGTKRRYWITPPPTPPALPVMGPGGISSNELRAWGRSQGFDIPDRGRLPSELLRAWERATEEVATEEVATEEAGERAE
ncbi:GNAT family N-acetyltransferase [Streptomyces sp. TLI_105]|uniref:GNAT family N-acetyltransferase n=1 Tax=Streptomyces sp. TLI_105 TaxID=1881019 RepID=UPI000897AEC6|nr:Predicted acetyltransferase [Streptomyces sp. TLI_105]